MFEIEWKRYSSLEDRYQHKTFLFKRKKSGGTDLYEIWENGVLRRNRLAYWDFISKAEKIVRGDNIPGDIWK